MTSGPPDVGPPRGWYPDPAEPGRERYWDGRSWTQVVRRADTITSRGDTQRVYQPAPPSGTDPARNQPLAGWWLKFFSGLIDYFLSAALTLVILLIFSRQWAGHLWGMYWDYVHQLADTWQAGTFSMLTPPQAYVNAMNTLTLLLGGVMALYTIIFLGSWGATLGQRAVGIRVIKAPLPASMLSPEARAAFKVERCGWLRAISKGLSWSLFSTGGSLFILVQLVNVLLPLWHKRKQSLTDLFANTLVIVGRSEPSETQSVTPAE